MNEERTIKRQELYDLVWSKPVTQIAKDFGISDVAVSKICKKLNVPKPGLGYWAKLQHGKKVEQVPLPAASESDPDTYTIRGSMDVNLNLTTSVIEKQKAFEARATNNIKVKRTLRNPHPLIQQTIQRKKAYDSASYHDWNSLPPGVNLSVSDGSYSRALKIMDALIKALDKRGYAVTTTSGYGSYTAVTIAGEELKFDIFEFSRQIPNPERSDYSYSNQTLLEPTGRLSLRIENYYEGQKSISDGKVKKLEDRLNEFVVILVKASEILKIRRKAREERAKERQWQAQKEREIAEAKHREKQMLDQLFENAEKWHKCQMVRRYIDAVKDDADDDWVEWVEVNISRIESEIAHLPSST